MPGRDFVPYTSDNCIAGFHVVLAPDAFKLSLFHSTEESHANRQHTTRLNGSKIIAVDARPLPSVHDNFKTISTSGMLLSVKLSKSATTLHMGPGPATKLTHAAVAAGGMRWRSHCELPRPCTTRQSPRFTEISIYEGKCMEDCENLMATA